MTDDARQGAPPRILVVDDNAGLRRVVQQSLEAAGYEVLAAEDGLHALRLAESHPPDLVVLDIMMPGLDGWQVCDRLRHAGDLAIILLTARGSEADVMRGFRLGADDYLTKPFSLAELQARVEAKLRCAPADVPPPVAYDDGTLAVDLRDGVVTRRGERVALSPKEYQLLACLVRARPAIVPHERLLREVWGRGYEEERAYLALYVRYLRAKLEDDPAHPVYVRTHHGLGYSFEGPGAAGAGKDV